ncbi:TPA: autoinducer 2 import system permease LsrD [Pasteurella multocida]|uniref:Autoinducer 2 import system permease protein LsrD n=3 Tax=Pasteurella multocida TaxID=747 RepID=Q9CLF9_PASMU|nr:autoinducer 2 ABC transporter permease LsrD [Pasteurella multocida]AWW60666.1 autoinducer 2 import system permease LsrD [Pasteurellaceae bacterium 12591]AAK03360.1 unknown [Pasteurella multocida subsp. multocida str. Pm70]AET16795.1 autoinducer 2 import system permease protein lsrD [Pasteurella multocida 36950]AFF25167.1 autoinducer 2 import system permease protein lsrD [Pasteurella multocida subsp. multocida str. HN06]AON58789.1 autoinducer 2 import system permease LsrD [Pasteurella multoc
MFNMKKYSWEIALFCLVIIEILGFGMFNPRMLDLNVLLYSTSDFIYIGMLALPLTMIIVSGGMDISFGSTVGLCAIFLGVLFKSDVPLSLAIPLTFLVGILCGVVNASLILYTKVNPLVITLGTMYLFGGGALLLSGFAGATGYEGIGGFPESLLEFANQTLFGIPTPIIYFLLMTLVFWLLMHKTTIGRSIFLIGQSERTSRYSAVPITGTLYIIYSAIGVVAAFVGILLVSYFGSARSDLGSSLLMPVLTAVVLGGANIYGGSGSIIGTAIAALLIGYLQQGLQMVGVSNEISSALSGALLIIVLIGKSISLHYGAIVQWIHRKTKSESTH